MGEEKMVITTLDDKLIDGGKQLIEQLDKDHVKVDAALWYYFDDTQNWKLLLSLPEVINGGPKATYQVIQGTFQKLRGLPFSLDDSTVAKPNSPLLKLLSHAISTDNTTGGIRFSNNMINGQLIRDAYIYRLLSNYHKRNKSVKSR
jgi:hypothetical protein